MNRRDRDWMLKRIAELMDTEINGYNMTLLREMKKMIEYEAEVQARKGCKKMKCEHLHKDEPNNAVCEDCSSIGINYSNCYCGNKIKQYDEGDDTMECCEECI